MPARAPPRAGPARCLALDPACATRRRIGGRAPRGSSALPPRDGAKHPQRLPLPRQPSGPCPGVVLPGRGLLDQRAEARLPGPPLATRGPGRAQGPQPWERCVPSATQARPPCLQPRQQPWDCAAPRRQAPRPSPPARPDRRGPQRCPRRLSRPQGVAPRLLWSGWGGSGSLRREEAPPSSQRRSPPSRGIRNLRQNHFFSPFTGEGWATEGSLLTSV